MLYGLRDRHADVFNRLHDQARTTQRIKDPIPGGSIMSKDLSAKANVKKKGKTIKEKQAAKRVKRAEQNGHSSNIPPTGH